MSSSDKKGCLTITWEIGNFELILEAAGESWLVAPICEVRDRLAVGCVAVGSDIVFQLSCIKGNCPIKLCHMTLVSTGDEVPLETTTSQPFSCSIERNSIYRQPILFSGGTLTLRCRVWKKAMKPREFRIHSVLQRVNFCRKHLYSSRNVIIEKDHVLLEMNIDEESKTGVYAVTLEGLIGMDRLLSFVDCKFSTEHYLVKEIHYFYNSMQTRCKITFKVPDSRSKNMELQVSCIVAIHKSCPHQQANPSPTESVKTDSEEVAMASGTLGKDLLHMSREALHSDATLNADKKSFSVPTHLENVCTVSAENRISCAICI